MQTNWNFENSYLTLPNIFYSKTRAEKFPNLKVLLKNKNLIDNLDLKNDDFDKIVLESINNGEINSFSQAYAGHQFGHFTILGDGRATLLGEHINNNNERFDIQLKGSGKTPYSRNGDGKGTLKSMLREYIVSEAMHNLNIKTTRSLAILNTGEKIQRETYEEGGILVRVAKSHIRIGTFEYFACRKDVKNLQKLADYTINRHFPKYNEILQTLRSVNINSEIYIGDGNLKSQMKYADKRNAPAVIFCGDDEVKSRKITLKNLKTGDEISLELKNLTNEIGEF